MTSAPANASAMPARARRLTRSPRNNPASSATKIGPVLTSRLAVPAVTVSSPALSSNW